MFTCITCVITRTVHIGAFRSRSMEEIHVKIPSLPQSEKEISPACRSHMATSPAPYAVRIPLRSPNTPKLHTGARTYVQKDREGTRSSMCAPADQFAWVGPTYNCHVLLRGPVCPALDSGTRSAGRSIDLRTFIFYLDDRSY